MIILHSAEIILFITLSVPVINNYYSTIVTIMGVACLGRCIMAQNQIKHSLVDGLMYPPYIDQKTVEELRDFALKDDDLFIVTYAKSGTTWMQQILKLIRKNGQDDAQRITDAIPWIEEKGKIVCEVSRSITVIPVHDYNIDVCRPMQII